MSGPARDAADAYCAAVNAHDLEALRQLFAEDVVAVNTLGEYRGREEVVGFYEQIVLANDVRVDPVHMYEAGNTCVVELEGRSPSTPDLYRMVDIFTVGTDGRIARLSIYRR